jgi:acyl transferase domain-containing protein/phosphopantetheinyl transferase
MTIPTTATPTTDIAIVGMSALFPGARDLRTYWQNILTKVNAVTDAPDEWAMPYYDPETQRNDRLYTRKGGFLGDLAEFNPLEFGIMPNSVDGGEPDHFLGLKLSWEALKDAGYLDRSFNPEKTGIILGRGTYINRGYNTLLQHGQIVDQTLDLLVQLNPGLTPELVEQIRQQLKASLPPFTAEMAPGLVPNVITGRIANRLNLMGPNYIIDAACASSLIAVQLAMQELTSGRSDMMLTGGVHASTPPQINMIFCQLKALAKEGFSPFGATASGTLLGEGLGILVLKRLADAERDGDRIYAVLKGVGSSSDGKALGLLAPRFEGEVLALERAYQDSGIDPKTVALVEAHGTGIPLGDRTEVQSLTHLFGNREQMPTCALGSVKSMIGHCIPAAGAASLIKTALALYHKIQPPMLCETVNPEIGIEKTPFYINTEVRPWIHGNPQTPRRAGVNSFGFGGINAHAIVEEYRGPQAAPALVLSQLPTELVLLSGSTREDLVAKLIALQSRIQEDTTLTLGDIAYTLSEQEAGLHRLALIVQDFPDLQAKLQQALEKLQGGARSRFQTRNGLYYTQVDPQQIGKTAFIFPGEGSQYTNMLADLCCYFPQVRAWFDLLDAAVAAQRPLTPSQIIFPPATSLTDEERSHLSQALYSMDVASESVFTSSMALYELLLTLGVPCDAMVGHSTGENAALIASGTVRLTDRSLLMSKIRHLNQIYQTLEQSGGIARGELMTVGAITPETLQQILAEFGDRVHFAMDNCPNQAVVFASPADMAAIRPRLKAIGAICTTLPFDRAYHTALFAGVSTAFRAFYDGLDVALGHTPLYSCATAAPFPSEPDTIRSLATQQWSSRVRFRETILRLHQEGFRTFVEVGPSGNLTGFVTDILQGCDHLAMASNNTRRSGLSQIQHLLARLWSHGICVNVAPLFASRSLKRLDFNATVKPQRPTPILELNMPTLKLSADFIKKVRDTLEPITEPTPVLNRTPEQSDITSASASGSAISQFAVESELQATLVAGHTQLMQTFFASQQRIAQSLQAELAESGISEGVPLAPIVSEMLPTGQRSSAERWPLLGNILHQDEQSLSSERRFELTSDLFLQDHTLGSQLSQRHLELLPLPVIPFTVSMEILAEAAHYLFGGTKAVTGLSDLRGYRWLSLDQGELTISIQAKCLPLTDPQTQKVQVRLYQASAKNPAQKHLVYEGVVHLQDRFPAAPAPFAFHLEQGAASRWPDADLYRTGMFHGPRFQGVTHIRQWNTEGIEAELQTIATHDFFQPLQDPDFQVDSGLLDAAGQLVGYWVSEQFGTDFNVFPFQVEAFHQYLPPLPPGETIVCRGVMRFLNPKQTTAKFDFIDAQGRVIARLEGWQDRYFNIPHQYYQCRLHPQTSFLSEPWMQAETGLICRRILPFPEGFLEDSWSIWQRVLAHLVLNQTEREFWYGLPDAGPRRTEWLLGRIVAKDAIRQWAKQVYGLALAPVDIEITATPLGQPLVSCPELQAIGALPQVSITHTQGIAVAAVVPAAMHIGVDLQMTGGLNYVDLLETIATPQERAILATYGERDRLSHLISFWSAKEAAAKALGKGLVGQPKQWEVYQYTSQSCFVMHQNQSLPVQLFQVEGAIFGVCQIASLPASVISR